MCYVKLYKNSIRTWLLITFIISIIIISSELMFHIPDKFNFILKIVERISSIMFIHNILMYRLYWKNINENDK